jgi:hypothetical protein
MVSANFPICFSSVGTICSAGRGRRAHRHISIWEAYGLKGQESIGFNLGYLKKKHVSSVGAIEVF